MANRAKDPWNRSLMDLDRQHLGWTYSRLAQECELTVATITRFLRKESHSPKTAKKIAFALGHGLDRYALGKETVTA